MCFHLKSQVPFSEKIHLESVRTFSPFAMSIARWLLSHGTATARAGSRFMEFTFGVRQGGSSACAVAVAAHASAADIASLTYFMLFFLLLVVVDIADYTKAAANLAREKFQRTVIIKQVYQSGLGGGLVLLTVETPFVPRWTVQPNFDVSASPLGNKVKRCTFVETSLVCDDPSTHQ